MVDVVVERSAPDRKYLEWTPVLAGALVASALSFVLFTFGAAIGLSLVSPVAGQSYGRWAVAIAMLWTLVVPITSFLVGGYLAGRMRPAWDNADTDEVEFRDGVHGLLVWAVSITIGAVLAFMAAAATAQVGASVATATAHPSDRAAIFSPAVDSLFRGTTVAQAPAATARPADTPAQPSANVARASPSTVQQRSPDVRDEAARILAASVVAGQLTATDREYLVQAVSQRAGVPPEEAEKRVDEAYASAVRAAEAARKATVLAALMTATALMIGLAAAWYAAQRGGHHRDQNIPARFGLPRVPIGRARPSYKPPAS